MLDLHSRDGMQLAAVLVAASYDLVSHGSMVHSKWKDYKHYDGMLGQVDCVNTISICMLLMARVPYAEWRQQ